MFIVAHQKADAEGHTLIIGNIPPNIARRVCGPPDGHPGEIPEG